MLNNFLRAGSPVLALTLLVAAPAPVYADPVADFYKGRNVEVYVAAGAGGGYGLYSRVLAEFMADHIPGSPSMTLKNGRLTRMQSTSPRLAGMVSRPCVTGDTPSPGTNTNVRKVTSSSPTARIAA